MSRTIQSLGPSPPNANRTLTFGSDWSKFDQAFPDRGFPWQYRGTGATSYTPQESGQQTTQNEEGQYYIKQHELLGQSAAPNWINGKPWSVNDDGNLLLRAIPTPAAYENIAYVVLNGFEVVSSTSNEIRVKGQNYYDRAAQASRVGINKHERGLYTGQPLRVKAGNSVYDITNIIDEAGATDPSSGTTFHRIQISGSLSSQPVAGNYVNVLRPTEYVSGMFTSRGTFAQQKGSWEARVKFQSGKGAFAAVWNWPNYHEWFSGDPATERKFLTGDKSVEIDMGECLGHAPDIWYHNAHQPSPYDPTLPDLNGGKTLRDFVTHKGLTPLNTPAGWTGDFIQQHQVLIDPSSADYIDGGSDWITIRWDHYTDNTSAWFVKRDDWTDFRRIADMHMSPHAYNGVIDERCWFLNNACKSAFNYEQERNDANYPRFTSTVPSSYDFEIDYLRVYQWDGETNGGSGLPDQSGIYPTGLGATPGNGSGATSGNGTGTTFGSGTTPIVGAAVSARGYNPLLGQGIRFSPGLIAGQHKYELQDPDLADKGTFIWDDYGTDATLVSGDRGPTLVLDVAAVTSVTPRLVRFVLDDVFTSPILAGNNTTLAGTTHTFTWQDPSPEPGTSYELFVDGSSIGTTSDKSLAVSGLPDDGSTLTVQVDAISASGTLSSTITVTAFTASQYVSLDVPASEASFTARDSSNNIVTQFTAGETYTVDVLWEDSNGDYAGSSLFITMDVDVGSEVFSERLSGTNKNRYIYTPPSTVSSTQQATFTWGRYDDSSQTTSQNASVTVSVVQGASTIETLNTPPLRAYGAWQASDWDATISPLPRIYSGEHQFIKTFDSGGDRKFEIKLVPSSIGSARVDMQARLPANRAGYRSTETMRFMPGFDFGRNQKAAKISTAGLGMQSPTLTRTPGGSDNANDGFMLRTMYAGSPSLPAKFAGYYYGADKVSTFGNSGEYLYMDQFAAIQTEVDYTIVKEVILNSDFNTSDGEIRIWVDGVLGYEATNRRILSAGNLDALWVLYFTVFWGGNSIDFAGNTTSYIQYGIPTYEAL